MRFFSFRKSTRKKNKKPVVLKLAFVLAFGLSLSHDWNYTNEKRTALLPQMDWTARQHDNHNYFAEKQTE